MKLIFFRWRKLAKRLSRWGWAMVRFITRQKILWRLWLWFRWATLKAGEVKMIQVFLVSVPGGSSLLLTLACPRLSVSGDNPQSGHWQTSAWNRLFPSHLSQSLSLITFKIHFLLQYLIGIFEICPKYHTNYQFLWALFI